MFHSIGIVHQVLSNDMGIAEITLETREQNRIDSINNCFSQNHKQN